MPNTLRTADRAYGIYDSVYHVYARYSMITKTVMERLVKVLGLRRG